MNEKWTAPSRKWFATQVTALAALATAWAQAGEWTTTLTVMAIGIASQAVIAYLVPNDPDQLRRDARAGERGMVEPLYLIAYVLVILILIVVLFAVIDRL